MTQQTSLKRSSRPFAIWLSVSVLVSAPAFTSAFVAPKSSSSGSFSFDHTAHVNPATTTRNQIQQQQSNPRQQPTALNVWWFGGTESKEIDEDSDSCELVAVRIEKTSPNSRRIAGDITVASPMADVWAILTDYNRLSTHVPNLVASKIVSTKGSGTQGDGQYQCRLYQKGAQKIIGFEFGADVTMDMTERVQGGPQPSSSDETIPFPEERKILFKCVDSLFFSEFDGEWSASEIMGENGEQFTKLSYVVDVRPNGPVPVAALEWRIREDVPTNLRAVKLAAQTVGEAGVLATRRPTRNTSSLQESVRRNVQFVRQSVGTGRRFAKMEWDEGETMAAYLKD